MGKENFTPSVDKKRFSIVIDVYENCSTLNINNYTGVDINLFEAIGALEYQKTGFMNDTRVRNLKKKLMIKQSKQKTNGNKI